MSSFALALERCGFANIHTNKNFVDKLMSSFGKLLIFLGKIYPQLKLDINKIT